MKTRLERYRSVALPPLPGAVGSRVLRVILFALLMPAMGAGKATAKPRMPFPDFLPQSRMTAQTSAPPGPASAGPTQEKQPAPAGTAANPPAANPVAKPAEGAVDASSTPATELKGDAFAMSGRYLSAIRVYEAVEPKSALLYNKIGIASEHMLMAEKARASFEEAVKLKPDYSDAWNNLGTLFHTQGDFRRAEKCYKRAIKLKPTNADAFQNLGTLLYAERKFKKGDAAYKQAIALDHNVMERSAHHGIAAQGSVKSTSEIHYHMALTYASAGNAALALDYLRRSILEGFHDRNRLLHEKEFAELRTSPVFLQMVDDLAKN